MRTPTPGYVSTVLLALLAAGLLALSAAPAARAVDDDLLAYRLYEEGRFAEAAELFTDPAWKGVALYRAQQWWRAADAFVRADDARSAHNLGNTYARLGYPELALVAFRRALAMDPALDDARHNAEVMLAVLALSEGDGNGGRSASEDEIERVERERETAEPQASDPGDGDGDEEEDAAEQDGTGEPESGEEEQEGDGDQTAPGDGGEADDAEREARAGDGGGALDGAEGEESAVDRASGESESAREPDDAAAAGLRRALEDAQANEQWLARIAHDPERFLERRIALELRRRRAAGQAAPEGGSAW